MPQLDTSSQLLTSPSDLTLDPNSPTISPATTPGSTHHDYQHDEEKCLTEISENNVTNKSNNKKSDKEFRNLKRKWNVNIWNLAPCWMACVSIIQILVFLFAYEPFIKFLRFEPVLRYQIWRFVTYMLLHWSKTHLILNVIVQCLIAIPLEVEQDGLRILAVYLWGGIFGALGACLFQPQPMVGASAGVYSILISHLAHLYLNSSNGVKYRKYRIFSVCVLAISDFIFYAFHARTAGHPQISLGAHASGGLAGALLGLLIYKADETQDKTKINCWRNIKIVRIVVFVIVSMLLATSCIAMIVLPKAFFVR